MCDLRREYGIDLLDLWRGRLSFYEICVYISGLPPDCATVRLIRDAPPEVEGWNLTNQLLGALIDTVRNMLSEEQVDSVIPKALTEASTPVSKPAEIQPASSLTGLIGDAQTFMTEHGG